MVMLWNKQIQKAYTFKQGGGGAPPPLISRPFAIYHVVMHDALNSIIPVYETYASDITDPNADADAAVVQAVYDALNAIGPQSGPARISIDSLYEVSMNAIPEGDRKLAGITLGKSVAQAVLLKRQGDAPYLVVTGFNPTPPSGTIPGQYKYVPPLNYALAGFHLMSPWVIRSANQFPVEPPYDVRASKYAKDYKEIMTLGELNSAMRTEDQRASAIFWAENASRGWNEVARQLLSSTHSKLNAWEAARFFAILHMTIADAYIAAFDGKIHYNFWRPQTAIHEGDADGNDETAGNVNWVPTLATPATAEYPSAYAMTGAAAGEFLIRHFKRNNISFSTNSAFFPGTRSFRKISDAIRENSLARIYVGYYFRHSVDVGERRGYDIGDYTYEHALPKRRPQICNDY